MDLGEASLSSSLVSEKAPAILAVPPSGSSYKQWSGFVPFLQPGHFSGLFGVNMFGYGGSDQWNENHRKQTLNDHVLMVTAAVSATGKSLVHLIGHSMGGGAVLAAAGSSTDLADKLASLTVFEPNLCSLLLAGNAEEQRVVADGDGFAHEMIKAAEKEDWDTWGRIYCQFWMDVRWDDLDERVKKAIIGATVPHTIHECISIKWAIDQGPSLAADMLDKLAQLSCKKRLIVSAVQGIGSKDSLKALSHLLKREAGFEIVHAPVGGHMGPVTHSKEVLPLMLPS